MRVNISTRHGHLHGDTQAKIGAKLEKLTRFFDRLTSVDLTVDLEHREEPVVELQVSAEHKHDFVATHQSADMMASVDHVLHKMEQQLRKYKEKLHDRHRGGNHREPSPDETS